MYVYMGVLLIHTFHAYTQKYMHCIRLCCNALHDNTVITIHCKALRYNTAHYITLQYMTIQYYQLQYIHACIHTYMHACMHA